MAETISLPTNAQVEEIKTINTSIDTKLGAMKTTGEDTNSKAGDIKDGVARLVEVTELIASKTGAFVTLAVTAATRDGVEVTGQTVSLYIWDADSGAYALAATKPYNGETVDFTVGYKAKYKVTISDTLTTRQDGLYDHFAPSEATGTALIDAAITLTYLDSGDNPDFIPGTSAESVPKTNIHSLTEFDRAEKAIKAQYDNDLQRIEAGLAFLVGVELPDVWTKDNGTDTVNDPLICADFSECEDADGNTFLGATLMRKWATVNSIQFDNRNQEVTAETTAQSGLYYYGWAAPYSSSSAYAKDTNFCTYDNRLWKCATAIAAAGEEWNAAHWTAVGWLTNSVTTTSSQILPFDETANYEAGSLCLYTDVERGFTGIYKCANAVEAGEWDETEWAIQVFDIAEASLAKQSLAAGAALPTGYAALFRTSLNAGGTYVQNAIRYGHNNYGTSAYRQYLNSAAGVGEWWEQKHAGQVAPYNPGTTTVRGYMAGCSEELLGLVKKVKVPCYANGNTDSAQGAYTTLDKFFLPSGTNMCGSVNANEGRAFPYMVRFLRECLEEGDNSIPACTVADYDSSVNGEIGVAYVAETSGMFYAWAKENGDNKPFKYINVTNDDRAADYAGKTLAHYDVKENPSEGQTAFPAIADASTSVAYFDDSTGRVWRKNNNAWAEITQQYYTYIATHGLVAKYRRRFSVTNHSSAVNARLRSAYRGTSYNAWSVYSSGYLLNYYYAGIAYVSVPACVIG